MDFDMYSSHFRCPFIVLSSMKRNLVWFLFWHYGDVIMSTIASQITSLTIVYSTVYSDADQRKHQSSASLAFVWGIHRGPVNSPHKWSVTRKMFPFDDVIMVTEFSWSSIDFRSWTRNNRVSQRVSRTGYIFFNIKRNTFKYMLHTPAPWHFDISVIYSQGFHSVTFIMITSYFI